MTEALIIVVKICFVLSHCCQISSRDKKFQTIKLGLKIEQQSEIKENHPGFDSNESIN
jgi:hypothetical protein